jgi:hypothetical protein
MITPPDPHLPEILLVVASKLSWRATGRGKGLGELVGSDGSTRTLTLWQQEWPEVGASIPPSRSL